MNEYSWQWLANLIGALVSLVIGGYVKHQHERIKGLEDKVNEIPLVYTSKEDSKDEFNRIIRILERIEDRINKQ